jgi:hypothetical protein
MDPETKLYGYVNKDFEWVIPPQFADASDFAADGLARVWTEADSLPETANAIIDATGDFAVGPFEDVRIGDTCGYGDDLIPAKSSDAGWRWGFITRAGEIALPHVFHDVSCFYEGRVAPVAFAEGSCGFVDREGEPAPGLPVEFACEGSAPSFSSKGEIKLPGSEPGEWLLVDSYGETVFSVTLPTNIVGFELQGLYEQGVAAAQVEGEYTAQGIIDRSGNWVLAPFEGYIVEGGPGEPWLAYLANAADEESYGFVNERGEWAIPAQFANANVFQEGKSCACQPNKYTCGFIDETGSWSIQPEFGACGSFRDGQAWASDGDLSNGRWGTIDETGAWIHEPAFAREYRPGSNFLYSYPSFRPIYGPSSSVP